MQGGYAGLRGVKFYGMAEYSRVFSGEEPCAAVNGLVFGFHDSSHAIGRVALQSRYGSAHESCFVHGAAVHNSYNLVSFFQRMADAHLETHILYFCRVTLDEGKQVGCSTCGLCAQFLE